VPTLLQPSLGPTFGLKGGASGGGRAQVIPAEAMNLHLTGDFHAVTAAHNLAAAMVDNHIHHGNPLSIDPGTVAWQRTMDVNDRELRDVVVGLGGRVNGPVRETGFVITAASEVMAVLSLARDLADLRARLGRVVVGRKRDGSTVTLEEVRAAGAMAALLREAMKPNLLQSLEGSPVLVHTGPFANVAHGTSSVAADLLALRLGELVITEAGFSAELGAEKFVDLKCRQGGLEPAAAVLVTTARALKHHGNARGRPEEEDLPALRRGAENLERQVAVVRQLGLPVVVAVNRFPGDTAAELGAILEAARAAGARAAALATPFADGGEGAEELARAVREAAGAGAPGLRFLYPEELPLPRKIELLATQLYGAAAVEFSSAAAAQLEEIGKLGFGRLPVCVAKTHLSMSHDPRLGPNPRGYTFPVREARLAAGAGFVTAMAGDIVLMPGLPVHPAAEAVDLDAQGRIVGLR
jgi:formate--tetrahydrofolate ligase